MNLVRNNNNKTLRKSIIGGCIIWLMLVTQSAYAISFDHDGAVEFFGQMVGSINSRNKQSIYQFFNFYMTSDAVIYKKSILLSPEDLQNPKSIKNLQYSKEEYISLIQSVTSIGSEYNMSFNLQSFQLLPNKYMAYATVSFTEVSLIATLPRELAQQNVVTTNCNFTLVSGANSPKIAGGNCIEKIVLNQ